MEEKASKEKVRYLHLGCGQNILPAPFENLDIRELEGVDHLGTVYPLDFEDDTFDLVYCSHVLEHFSRNETQDIINEWVRVLKPGGTLRLAVPNLENLIKIYEGSGDIDSVIGPFMGGQTYKENFHYMLFDQKSLTEMMNKAGLVAVHTWDHRRTEHSEYWDFSQAVTNGISISLNLEGRKKINDDGKPDMLQKIQSDIEVLLECNKSNKGKTYTEVLGILAEALGT